MGTTSFTYERDGDGYAGTPDIRERLAKEGAPTIADFELVAADRKSVV